MAERAPPRSRPAGRLIQPMLATAGPVPVGPGWAFEVKFEVVALVELTEGGGTGQHGVERGLHVGGRGADRRSDGLGNRQLGLGVRQDSLSEDRVVAALDTLPVRGLVMTDPEVDPASLPGTQRIRVVPSAPHTAVIPTSRVVSLVLRFRPRRCLPIHEAGGCGVVVHRFLL
jgi:hypothetical protein